MPLKVEQDKGWTGNIRDYAYAPNHVLHHGPSAEYMRRWQTSNSETRSEDAPDSKYYGQAIALYDFTPQHSNEFALKKGDTIWIAFKYGQGWLVAQNMTNPQVVGLVPEDYCQLISNTDAEQDEWQDVSSSESHCEFDSLSPVKVELKNMTLD